LGVERFRQQCLYFFPLPQGQESLRPMWAMTIRIPGRVGGAEGQNRTVDTSLFRAVLYQLSYLGTEGNGPEGVDDTAERPSGQGWIAVGCASGGPAAALSRDAGVQPTWLPRCREVPLQRSASRPA
jgi:hypothetical protein